MHNLTGSNDLATGSGRLTIPSLHGLDIRIPIGIGKSMQTPTGRHQSTLPAVAAGKSMAIPSTPNMLRSQAAGSRPQKRAPPYEEALKMVDIRCVQRARLFDNDPSQHTVEISKEEAAKKRARGLQAPGATAERMGASIPMAQRLSGGRHGFLPAWSLSQIPMVRATNVCLHTRSGLLRG
mmetsp:Transcript_71109/g.170327  ORF Transcript_71109/g.170327 Transcript_71109/m.170327 type:complete len:180 (+) Transcript_71109:373-912(+)